MENVKVEKLILDYSIYPRTEINAINVRDLIEALKARVTIPPILADKKSKRVVDGFHRLTAYKRLKMETIPVEWKSYKTEADLYVDAVRHNSEHGQKLSRYDQARIITKAQELGVDPGIIANAMNLTAERIEQILVAKTANANKDKLVPIKRTIGHLRGQSLSKRQLLGNERAGGMSAIFYFDQVTNLIENDLIDTEATGIPERIEALHKLLGALIRKLAA